jgi:hypothetical protein
MTKSVTSRATEEAYSLVSLARAFPASYYGVFILSPAPHVRRGHGTPWYPRA